MVKKVIKIGSSLGVTVSSDQLKKLALTKGSEVEVIYNSRRDSIEIRKPRIKVTNSQLLEKVSQVAARHSADLKRLNDEW